MSENAVESLLQYKDGKGHIIYVVQTAIIWSPQITVLMT